MPKIHDLSQSGPEWHKWRAGGLGGSDAPALLGEVQWTSPETRSKGPEGPRQNSSGGRGGRHGPQAARGTWRVSRTHQRAQELLRGGHENRSGAGDRGE